MTILYQWQTRGEKPCFACSRWNGQIFYTADSLPELPVHPNCECRVIALDPNIEILEALIKDIQSIISSSQGIFDSLHYLMTSPSLSRFKSELEAHQRCYSVTQHDLPNLARRY